MNMHSSFSLRRAEVSDAAAMAKLINLAGEGIPNWLWTRAAVEGQHPMEIGAERARRTTGGFSYTNAQMAETDGRATGMVLSYAITQATEGSPDDVPAPLAPFVALENQSVGTWYINALAVFPAAQGQGHGTQLLRAAEQEARAHDIHSMSIQVYAQNTRAVALYERFGYVRCASAPVRLHPCPPYYTGEVLLLKKPLS